MKPIKLITIALALLVTVVANAANQVNVTGKVVDEGGDPLVGVYVEVKGEKGLTALTDIQGRYSIPGVSSDAILVFSYIGMTTVEEKVNGRSMIDIVMKEDALALEGSQVVEIGYGSVQKKDLTGSVASVKGDVLSSYTSGTVHDALQGRVAGLVVKTTGAAPGASPMIRIRGTSSINGGNNPLWIIDGFAGMPGMLNNADIESVEVLKDASATAIYGSRGSNGVIIVTTKKARDGISQVEYTGSESVATLAKKLPLMNASEYMEYQNAISNSEYFSEEEIEDPEFNTDWQDLMFRKAHVREHSLSVRGSVGKTRVAAGLSWMDQEGIMIGTDYSKLSMRTSVNHEISKTLSIQANMMYTRSLRHTMSGLLSSIVVSTPTVPPINEETGEYTLLREVYSFSPSGLKNPYASVRETEYKWTSNRTMTNMAFIWKPVKQLTIKTAANLNASNSTQDDYVKTTMLDSTGSASIEHGEGQHIESDNTITWADQIGDHKFSVMGGATFEQSISRTTGVSGTGFLSDLAGVYGIAGAEIAKAPTASYSKWVMLSFIGRANYSYKDKYLATVSLRADGSSRYSKGSKWGTFPSAALAWRASEEGFIKDNIRAINNLKFRVGYGSTGNTAIEPYATMDLLTAGDAVFGKTVVPRNTPSNKYAYGLIWETTDQFDAGIDLGLWRDRIRITADYYYKNTYNLLNTVDLPNSSGYVNGTKNIGTMMNKGFEFQLDARILDMKNLKWDLGGNISFNRNKVVELPYGEDVYGTKRSITIMQDYINLLREGEPIGIFYGYKEAGYDDTGKLTYMDYSGPDGVPDGKINEYDKVKIGDPNPDYTFGINTTISWRRLSLSAYVQGSVGNDIYSLSMAHLCYQYAGGRGMNTLKEVLYDHWEEFNTDAKYPALTAGATASLKMSDRFVYDGTYVRLKNLELSYAIPFPQRWVRKCVAYISAQNLVTLTDYPFYSPDADSYGGSSSVNQGIEYYTYPAAKSFTLGVRVGF